MDLATLPRGDGLVDLLGDDDPTGAHPGQRLMVSRALPGIYERVWRPSGGGGVSWEGRPSGGGILLGAMGPGMRGEHGIALEMLPIGPADKVLDVACGPGYFTRSF